MLFYHDTLSAKRILHVFANILPILSKIPAYRSFLCDTLLSALFRCIKITYHQDMHVDIIQVLTQLYILSLESFVELLRMSITRITGISNDTLLSMESNMPNVCTSLKDKSTYLRDFFISIPEVRYHNLLFSWC